MALTLLLSGLVPWAGIGSAFAADDLTRAREFYEQRQYQAAIVVLKSRLQQDPNDIDARLLLTDVYLDRGRGADALKEVEAAIDLGADPTASGQRRAEALLLLDRYDEAADQLGTLPQDLPEVLVLQGRLALARQDTGAARDLFARAVELAPQAPWPALGVALTGDDGAPLATIDAVAKVVERFPDFAPAQRLLASLYVGLGEHAKATHVLTALLLLDPEDVSSRQMRAQALITLDRFDEARADLTAIEASGAEAKMQSYLRAVIAYQSGEWRVALEQIQAYLRAQGRHPNALAMAGLAQLNLGQPQSAVEYLEQAVAVEPGNLLARRALARAYVAISDPHRAAAALAPLAEQAPSEDLLMLSRAFLARGETEASRDWATRSSAMAPGSIASELLLIEAQIQAGDRAGAIARLREIVPGQGGDAAGVLLAEALLAEGQADAALGSAAEMEERTPRSPAAVTLHGRMLRLTGADPELVRQKLERALELDPAYIPALLEMARLLLGEERFDLADAYYQKVLARDATNRTALIELAQSAERQGDVRGLQQWLDQAAGAHPSDIEIAILHTQYAAAAGLPQAAIERAQALVQRFPEDRAALQNLVATALVTQRFDAGGDAMAKLLDRFPDRPELHQLAGQLAGGRGDRTAAIEHLRRALRLQPRYQLARIELARVLAAEGDLDAAIAELHRAQDDYPDAAAAYELEGELLVRQRSYDAAIAPLQRALQRNRSAVATQQLAEAYLGTEQHDAAIELLRGWIGDHPDDVGAHAQLGWAYQVAGKRDLAVAAYRRAAAPGNPDPRVLNNLALLLHAAGDRAALDFARQAYELQPQSSAIADTYGWLLAKAGEADRAVPLLMEAYLKNPKDPEVGYHAAYALNAAGRGDDAAQIVRGLIAAYPDHPGAEEWQALLRETAN